MNPFFELLVLLDKVLQMYSADYDTLKEAYNDALESGSPVVSYTHAADSITYDLDKDFVQTVIGMVDASGIFEPVPVVCTSPTGLATGTITASSIVFNWGAVGVAINYQYAISLSATDPVGPGNSTNATTYTANGLTAGTPYYFHLRSSCGAGNYSPWIHISATTLEQ